MSDADDGNLPTQSFRVAQIEALGRRRAGLTLRIIGDGLLATHPLPERGDLVIGRAEGVDIRVDHPSISRRHALLKIGETLTLVDLGSVNGTRVGERALEPNVPREINAGEVLELGTVMMVVQRQLEAAPPRRVWTHGAFEARLEGECARAGETGGSFVVARILLENQAHAATVESAIIGAARSTDMIANYAAGEWELLMADCGQAEAERALRNLTLQLASQGVDVRTGMAGFPRDGRDPEALVSRAGQGVRATASSEVIVVQDGAMQRLHKLVERVAQGNISVLLLGETGVGKEVFAFTVHRLSPRANKPFLRLNCVTFSESLLESELFGHERGAFTGAVQAKPGQLETADGGTVFLDEVGELPLSTQVKLLRVIEERSVTRVGGLKSKQIDVRFIAATNRDLEAEIQSGRFRQDLFFRLNGFSLTIPPLRERVSEIEPLARAFLMQACRNARRAHAPELSREAWDLLRAYSWPGNVRELRNVIERAVLLCAGDLITSEHLPVDKMHAGLGRAPHPTPPPHAPPPNSYSPQARLPVEPTPTHLPRPTATPTTPLPIPDLRSEMESLKKQRILDALAQCGGNQSQAARLLGMPRNTLLAHLDAYGVPRPRKRPNSE